MKDKTSAAIEDLKLLLEIWKALEEPRLREPPVVAQTIRDGQRLIGSWIEYHLKTLPKPPSP